MKENEYLEEIEPKTPENACKTGDKSDLDVKKGEKMKTREEVEALKRDWEGDAIWDLETTIGFEEYAEELKAFRLQKEAEWGEARDKHLLARANKLCCSQELVVHIEWLEKRIEEMEALIEKQAEYTDKRFLRVHRNMR